eukprot:c12401_g2_i1 orf=1376-1705(+)
MPSWFGSKTSTNDVKKKKSLENILDGVKRKLKPKHNREEKRSSSLDSSSDTSSLWSGSRSPCILALDDVSRHAAEKLSFPLPSVPSASTNSGRKCAHNATTALLTPKFL